MRKDNHKRDLAPTLKQQLFAREYVRRKGNATQSALKVYDAKNYQTAKMIGITNLQKPAVQHEIQRLLNKAGLGMESVADDLRTAMKSGIGVKATNADSIHAIDMILRLHNAYPDKINKQVSVSIRDTIQHKSYSDIKHDLEHINNTTNTILSEIE